MKTFVPQDYWEIRANFGDYEGLWINPETKDARCLDRDRADAVRKSVAGRVLRRWRRARWNASAWRRRSSMT